MVPIPMKSLAPYTKQTVLSINRTNVQDARSSHNITSINNNTSENMTDSVENSLSSSFRTSTVPPACSGQIRSAQSDFVPAGRPVPGLVHPVQKGQKISLESSGKRTKIRACFGWNTDNPACDVDVSAFLLNQAGKVIGDSWFVFYGQPQSPDGSTVFRMDDGADREMISIDFTKLNPAVAKMVFVLTIHEAFEKKLNFSMIREAYIRIMDAVTEQECVSFQMDEYYSSVTSMMIGELYRHNDTWKFNAIGNGVARDLAGLCELYGVQVI